MKAAKAVPVLLAVGALLVGCGGDEWSGEVRFQVTRLNPASGAQPAYANLEIDQEEPKSIEPVSTRIADLDRLPAGVAVGDAVVCRVRQSDESGFDQRGVRTEVDSCRRPD
ncbi:hypothetical protein [Saccharothrix algeriensis]|uniref:Lipoprotein n=1 Tax=Saccharothrix algeriensis TaxID=173560 RepID=A0A8T8HRX4_9PSEU|nr:hypothetical protein [Saccharothrix algeriensis]MBM7812427.1 hypothetical protein [Saccharothrix algeriensis]QTR01177.1 hypothetical protein J7S33_16945 [Saccharothrix algeriensis]